MDHAFMHAFRERLRGGKKKMSSRLKSCHVLNFIVIARQGYVDFYLALASSKVA